MKLGNYEWLEAKGILLDKKLKELSVDCLE